MLVEQSDFQFFNSSAFDLPDSFFRNSKLLTESFQSDSFVFQSPLPDNMQFPFIERIKRNTQPADPALHIYNALHNLILQRVFVYEKVDLLRTSYLIPVHRRRQGTVRT